MLPPKDVGETVKVSFDFAEMVADLGLADVELIDPEVETGRDAGDGELVEGAVSTSGLIVTQTYTGGTRKVTYEVACYATFSNGERRRIHDFLQVI